ncbi:MAG TPA: PEP/pyruvate-binding domain-containing protein [Candidatus Eisenbacteria bacterium]|nr:PEP/pyruvate-binding domain-containing protein [Candidatus Eisenbacteria bacterium]
MSPTHEPTSIADVSNPFQAFQDLMPFRVQDILLVSSLYDSFTLQEDGRLNELIAGEFLELSLPHMPGLTHVSSGAEALQLATTERRFNLIITTLRAADMDATELARHVKRAGLDVPVVAMAYDNDERKDFERDHDLSDLDGLFLWQGNARVLVAIVKYVEDLRNVAHDTAAMGVRVVLVVEDNVRYYSSFLPEIYTEIIRQSASLISEGINPAHKLVRTRARPKLLLATTFEQAWRLFTEYEPYILGIISDVEFPRAGASDREAGFELARRARERISDLPIVLQSSRPEFAAGAAEVGAAFVRKYSETLLQDLRAFMVEYFAYGDFVFRLPDGTEVDRAKDLKSLEEKLRTVPAESINFHGERNHFSNWFTARTEFALARKMRPRKVSDFDTVDGLRHDLIASIAEYRREQSETLVADFDPKTFDPESNFFARIGNGSVGGKARGLAFARYLLNYHGVGKLLPGVRIAVPPAVVLATDCFDRFLAQNGLRDLALNSRDDDRILEEFLRAPLPRDVARKLRAFVEAVRWPLAVRSSSLLEDSQYQPFTGVYETFMLPNNHPDVRVRLRHLMTAIRRVYASTFLRQAKDYLHATPYRLEEEKMAVAIQKVVGANHEDRFYPDFSGVARSFNYYPTPPLGTEDGVAAVALGMGRSVVAGERCLSFCPRQPQAIVQFSTVKETLANSQRDFWAVVLGPSADLDSEQAMREQRFGLDVAERDGTLAAVGSTYSNENQAVYDGLSRPGVRLVTFAPILKHDVFPLAGILSILLEVGSQGMNRPAEIEFAACLSDDPARPHEFGFLQMRPLVLHRETEKLDLDEAPLESLLCRSNRVMGNGTIGAIHDVVVVDFHRFDRSQSRAAASEIARFNHELSEAGRPYLLIGVGRWGSTDPWLGIPVTWDQISGARVIVESGFKDFCVIPSQGSHFFQNLTSFQVGYFTVNADHGEGHLDWEWLAAQPAEGALNLVRHLRVDRPIVVKMNGRKTEGLIYKPGRSPA